MSHPWLALAGVIAAAAAIGCAQNSGQRTRSADARRGIDRAGANLANGTAGASPQLGAPATSPSADPKPGEKLSLRRNFKPGQVNYYIIEREEITRQNLMGMRFTTRRLTTDSVVERIASVVPDGIATIAWTLDRTQYHRADMGKEVRFDSVSDAPTVETRVIADLINRPLSIRQSPIGQGEMAPPGAASRAASKPAAAANTAASAASAASSAPATRNAFQAPSPPGKTGIGLFYDAIELPKILARITTDFLPARPVAIGDTWELTYRESKEGFGTMVQHVKYTLTSIDAVDGDKQARIKVEGDGQLDAAAANSGQPAKGDRTITLRTCRWSGDIEFDLARGRVQTMTLRHQNDIDVEMKSKDGQPVDIGSGEERVLRVRASDTPPPKPIVVKPPQATQPGANPAGATAFPRPMPSTQPTYPRPDPQGKYRFTPPTAGASGPPQTPATRPVAPPSLGPRPLPRTPASQPATRQFHLPPSATQPRVNPPRPAAG